MLTTYNHVLLGVTAGAWTAGCTTGEKVLVVAILAVSHLVLDAIPHMHFYDYNRLKETLPGAIFELGGGLIVLLVSVFLCLTKISHLWLVSCVLSANLVDFLVAAKIRKIIRLNKIAHWWEKRVSSRALISYEVVQTIILFGLLWKVIK